MQPNSQNEPRIIIFSFFLSFSIPHLLFMTITTIANYWYAINFIHNFFYLFPLKNLTCVSYTQANYTVKKSRNYFPLQNTFRLLLLVKHPGLLPIAQKKLNGEMIADNENKGSAARPGQWWTSRSCPHSPRLMSVVTHACLLSHRPRPLTPTSHRETSSRWPQQSSPCNKGGAKPRQ